MEKKLIRAKERKRKNQCLNLVKKGKRSNA
jgi:hypothetical protein